MTDNNNEFRGEVWFIDRLNRFIPDSNVVKIRSMLSQMELLLSGYQIGSLYYDPKNKEYWNYIQYIDETHLLKKVTKEWIQEVCPDIDFSRTTPVDWLENYKPENLGPDGRPKGDEYKLQPEMLE